MRVQSSKFKRQRVAQETERERRKKALTKLKAGSSLRAASSATGVSRATCDRLKHALQDGDSDTLQKLMDPVTFHPGRPSVLSDAESILLATQMKDAAKRGYPVDLESVRRAMKRIANDGRQGFSTADGLPSTDFVRTWRSRHRELTFTAGEDRRRLIKLHGDSISHATTFANALEAARASSPDIFDSPARLWNLDETDCCAGLNRRRVSLQSALKQPAMASSTAAEKESHVSAVMAISAAGHIAPPVFIVQAPNVLQEWFRPLGLETYTATDGTPHPFTYPDWFPKEGRVFCTGKDSVEGGSVEGGSMEGKMLPMVITHVDNYARKHLKPDEKYVLTVDEHVSSNGCERPEVVRALNMEVVQVPARASHFLQPCEQNINKSFKRGIREARDELDQYGLACRATVRMILMVGVMSWRKLTEDDARKSFQICGLWPMDFRFLSWARKETDDEGKVTNVPTKDVNVPDLDDSNEAAENGDDNSDGMDPKRETDSEVLSNVKEILREGGDACTVLNKVALCVNASGGLVDILQKLRRDIRPSTSRETA